MSHFLAFISASLIIFGTLPAAHSSEKRPNIIFFLIDDNLCFIFTWCGVDTFFSTL